MELHNIVRSFKHKLLTANSYHVGPLDLIVLHFVSVKSMPSFPLAKLFSPRLHIELSTILSLICIHHVVAEVKDSQIQALFFY